MLEKRTCWVQNAKVDLSGDCYEEDFKLILQIVKMLWFKIATYIQPSFLLKTQRTIFNNITNSGQFFKSELNW